MGAPVRRVLNSLIH